MSTNNKPIDSAQHSDKNVSLKHFQISFTGAQPGSLQKNVPPKNNFSAVQPIFTGSS
jgi:hypothetical protein